MSLEKLTPLKQLNDYGCGPYALLNFFRRMGVKFNHEHIARLEHILKTSKTMGTSESQLKLALKRYGCQISVSNKFIIKKLQKHLSNGGQAIVLYLSDADENEYHYCNVFEFNGTHYIGANFYQKNGKYIHRVTKKWLESQVFMRVFYISR